MSPGAPVRMKVEAVLKLGKVPAAIGPPVMFQPVDIQFAALTGGREPVLQAKHGSPSFYPAGRRRGVLVRGRLPAARQSKFSAVARCIAKARIEEPRLSPPVQRARP